ncbi:MAG: hypothetical protein JXB32_00285 [Deltaproteobacteria bacterium]|nr:hypothetical protein [Deltaproteobacteria bacterium]
MQRNHPTRETGQAVICAPASRRGSIAWLVAALCLSAAPALAQPAAGEAATPEAPATTPGPPPTVEPDSDLAAAEPTLPVAAETTPEEPTGEPPTDADPLAGLDPALAAAIEAAVAARVEAAVAEALAAAAAATPAPTTGPEAGTDGESPPPDDSLGDLLEDDELAALIGADLAAELRADEESITGQVAGDAAYLAATDTGSSGGRGGEVGPSNLMNPAMSLIGTFAAAYFTDENHPARGGHVPASNGLHLMEAEFGIEAVVDPYFYMRGFFMFGLDFFEAEEVYAETMRLPGGLKVRLGQMLAPFGRTNQAHCHTWEFVDAPLPVQRFLSGEQLRTPSLELTWLAPVPFFLKATAWAGMPGLIPPAGSTPDERTWGEDEDYDFLYLGRLETHIPFDDEWSMSLGASAATGPAGQGADTRSDLFGGDLFLRYKPLTSESYFEFDLTIEGAYRQRQFPGNRLVDWALAVEPMFRVAKQWRLALRGDVAEGDLTRGDTMTGPGRDFGEERGSASVTYFPTEFSQLRLQGTVSHPHGAAWDGPDLGGEVFLQVSYALGAHGAHPF